jgi:hypothetical protein
MKRLKRRISQKKMLMAKKLLSSSVLRLQPPFNTVKRTVTQLRTAQTVESGGYEGFGMGPYKILVGKPLVVCKM